MPRRILTRVVFFSLLGSFAACVATEQPAADDCETLGCAPGTVCLGGVCVTACNSHGDCNLDEVCDAGTCRAGGGGACNAGNPCVDSPDSCYVAGTGRCIEGRCGYDLVTCEIPPAPGCNPANNAWVVYAEAGACVVGDCVYGIVSETPCPDCATSCQACSAGTCPASRSCGVGGSCELDKNLCVYTDAPDGSDCAWDTGVVGTCFAGRCYECETGADCTHPPFPSECLLNATCINLECQYNVDVGKACGADACVDGTRRLDSQCAVDGSCASTNDQSCGGYACAADALSCRDTCAIDTDCAAGYGCDAPSCSANGSAVPGESSLVATPNSALLPDGAAAATLVVTLRDALDQPVVGQAVTLLVSGGGATLTQPSQPTDSAGQTEATLTATVGGVKTVSIVSPAGLAGVTAQVSFSTLSFQVSEPLVIGPTNQSEVWTVTVQNNTATPASLTFSLPSDGLLSLNTGAGTCSTTIPLNASSSCTIAISFIAGETGASAGVYSSTLTVSDGTTELQKSVTATAAYGAAYTSRDLVVTCGSVPAGTSPGPCSTQGQVIQVSNPMPNGVYFVAYVHNAARDGECGGALQCWENAIDVSWVASVVSCTNTGLGWGIQNIEDDCACVTAGTPNPIYSDGSGNLNTCNTTYGCLIDTYTCQ